MPYRSTRQRAYIHAAAARGESWAQRFAAEADRMAQPHVEAVRRVRKRLASPQRPAKSGR